jgi:hypothetical protein
MIIIKTASWFTPLPPDHVRIGISRGIRGVPAGYRRYPKLNPGDWFNRVPVGVYVRRYDAEVLALLDPRVVAAELRDMAGGHMPVLCCYERAGNGAWCHRALVAEWLAKALYAPVPELGFEDLPPDRHPLHPRQL